MTKDKGGNLIEHFSEGTHINAGADSCLVGMATTEADQVTSESCNSVPEVGLSLYRRHRRSELMSSRPHTLTWTGGHFAIR